MEHLFHNVTLKRNGNDEEQVDPSTYFEDKLVVLYFSAKWCPPCRKLSPLLKGFYSEVKSSHPELELVFVSSDKSQADFDSFRASDQGPWLYVPYDCELLEMLPEQMSVEGIPALVVLRGDGAVALRPRRQTLSVRLSAPIADPHFPFFIGERATPDIPDMGCSGVGYSLATR